jgi:hypothetical protein
VTGLGFEPFAVCGFPTRRSPLLDIGFTTKPYHTLALRQQFSVHGEALERVEVFKYLGRLPAQDDDDIQAIRAQLRKARGTWARVGQVLRAENVPPRVAKAVVQAVLLYGSETWVLSTAALASLEGFHIRAAYRMAVRHKPRRAREIGGSTRSRRTCWKSVG